MTYNKILVPVDFSTTSFQAAYMAASISKSRNMKVSLLHIQNEKSDPEAEDKLRSLSGKLQSEESIECDYIIRAGNIFTDIPKIACDHCYRLMIIGSHGIKGIREIFFGTDILKLIKDIPIPVLVIHENYKLPPNGFKNILFPASSHKVFSLKIEATIYIADMFNSEVHLYTFEKPGLTWSDGLKSNIEKAKREFELHKINYKRVNEQQTIFSVGYSKQILQYAKKANVDLISLMSIPTDEHFYIADSDKERILANDMGIPVFCISDKKMV